MVGAHNVEPHILGEALDDGDSAKGTVARVGHHPGESRRDVKVLERDAVLDDVPCAQLKQGVELIAP